MKINLNNSGYIFLVGHQHESSHRAAFDNATQKVFKLSFEGWYQSGYWKEKYTPYTLFHNGKAVANASINIMDFNYFGKKQRYIQIGTVLTIEDYRHKGLSRFLMEKILEDWNGKCDFIYLFANDTVLEMYPKYDFTQVKEYQYFKKINNKNNTQNFEKINTDKQENRTMLYSYLKNSVPSGIFSMQENADLVMFYSISPYMKDNVYYLKSLDVIVFAKFNNTELLIYDVFSRQEVELDRIIESLADSNIQEVVLGFSPKNCCSYQVRELKGDDALFVQKNKTALFERNKIMFPLLSHA